MKNIKTYSEFLLESDIPYKNSEMTIKDKNIYQSIIDENNDDLEKALNKYFHLNLDVAALGWIDKKIVFIQYLGNPNTEEIYKLEIIGSNEVKQTLLTEQEIKKNQKFFKN